MAFSGPPPRERGGGAGARTTQPGTTLSPPRRGAGGPAKSHKPNTPAYHRRIAPLREIHDRFQRQGQIGPEPFEESTAADMGCLVGEMHLKQGEFERAIEAFTRSLVAAISAGDTGGKA